MLTATKNHSHAWRRLTGSDSTQGFGRTLTEKATWDRRAGANPIQDVKWYPPWAQGCQQDAGPRILRRQHLEASTMFSPEQRMLSSSSFSIFVPSTLSQLRPVCVVVLRVCGLCLSLCVDIRAKSVRVKSCVAFHLGVLPLWMSPKVEMLRGDFASIKSCSDPNLYFSDCYSTLSKTGSGKILLEMHIKEARRKDGGWMLTQQFSGIISLKVTAQFCSRMSTSLTHP